MDRWAWQHLNPWLAIRVELPVGALVCVLKGPTSGRPRSAAAARAHCVGSLSAPTPAAASHPTSFATHIAVEMARERVLLNAIQRQLGHDHLGITSVYLQGIDNSEIIDTVHARPAPMLPASAGPHDP